MNLLVQTSVADRDGCAAVGGWGVNQRSAPTTRASGDPNNDIGPRRIRKPATLHVPAAAASREEAAYSAVPRSSSSAATAAAVMHDVILSARLLRRGLIDRKAARRTGRAAAAPS